MTLLTLFVVENGGPTSSPMFGYSTELPLDERYRTEKGYMAEIQLAAHPIELRMEVYLWFIQESIRFTNPSEAVRKNMKILFGGAKPMHAALVSVCSRFLL